MSSAEIRLALWLTSPTVPHFNLRPRHVARLARELPRVEVVPCPDAESFKAALPDTDAAVVWVFKQEWLALAPRLRWLATPAAGADYFAFSPPPGCRFTHGSFHGRLMAETVAGYLLGQARQLFAAARLDEPWQPERLSRPMRLLRGSRVTILGFGHIGRWIGRLVKPFAPRLVGVKRSPAPPPDYFAPDDRVVTADRLDEVLPETDHLVLVLPRLPETDRLVDERRLRLLPAGAAVYNVGRGNALDERALRACLEDGHLAGACLDVATTEPPPADSPLRGVPNLLLTPHVSAAAPEYLDLYLDEFVPEFRRWLAAGMTAR